MVLKVKAGTPRKMDPDDNPTFDQYMHRIDNLVYRAVGCSVHDLPDCRFRDWYECRVRPVYATQRALRRAGAEE